MSIQLLVFYAFAITAVGAATMVVTSSNPVRAALFLVLSFFACAGLWMLAHAEFLSLVLILVYVGAVMTLFLFVIMMLNIDHAAVKRQFVRFLPLGIGVVGLLVFLMLVAIRPENFAFAHLAAAKLHGPDYNNTKELGSVLYTNYAYAFEVAGVLLLVAIISAISLAHRGPRNCKTQQPQQQIRVRKEDRIRIVKMDAEKD